MSVEIEKKKRKAPAKKAATEGETKPKATREASSKVKAEKVETPVAAELSNVRQWPTHEEIALLAHRYYELRGGQDGFHVQDWLQAEKELQAAS